MILCKVKYYLTHKEEAGLERVMLSWKLLTFSGPLLGSLDFGGVIGIFGALWEGQGIFLFLPFSYSFSHFHTHKYKC